VKGLNLEIDFKYTMALSVYMQPGHKKVSYVVSEFTTSSTTSSPSPSFPPGYPAQDAPLPDAEQTPSERSIWWLTWEAHVYFSGTLFILLALCCTVNILRLHTFSLLFSRGYFVGLNLCIVVFQCTSRVLPHPRLPTRTCSSSTFPRSSKP
jgi:hypothetical protein